MFAGYTVASIARVNPMKSAYALVVIQLVIGIFVQSMYWHVLPLWYNLSFLILLVPGILIGARMRRGLPTPGGFEPGPTP
jgi:hypothetical protein